MPILKNIGANLPAEPGEAGEGFYDGPVPPAGVYRVKVKFVQVKENRNGDPMLNGVAEIAEPKGSKKSKFNGYGIWFNQNVTDQGAPYLNQFLTALGMSYKDFKSGKVQVDAGDPPKIIKVGGIKAEDRVCNLTTRRGEYNGEERLESVRWSAIKDEDADEDDDIIEEDEDLEEDDVEDEDEVDEDDESEDDEEDDEDEEDDSDEDEDDESEEEDDEEGYTREELDDMAVLELKSILKEAGWTAADYKGYSKDDLIAAILGEEDEDEDADDAEDDDEPPF